MQMSNSGDLQAELIILRRMGVVGPNNFGAEEGVNWLIGASEGKAQLLWPLLAQKMWDRWLYDALANSVGLTTP